MEMILRLEKVSAYYGKKSALKEVSMSVPKKQITAIIGPSGCGKSTLLRCINSLLSEEKDASYTGDIFLGEKNTRDIEGDELRRRIGMVFQTPSPFPFSVYKNMTYAPKYNGVHSKKELDRIAVEKLKMTGLFDEVSAELDKSALKLSGGQQQRLCIARALTVDPEILMLDEPCSALDIKSSAIIEKMLAELKKTYTIIIVTHNLAQAKRIADRTVFMYDGHVIEEGPTDEIFGNPKKEETKDFLSGVFG
ncbi:MAG: phosphate ABC transporter ATP-binding protein [Clostridia bacterium]|nr:phosphate ABC transporter ATP-binding protein [Clostridia bacterium]